MKAEKPINDFYAGCMFQVWGALFGLMPRLFMPDLDHWTFEGIVKHVTIKDMAANIYLADGWARDNA